ncbi:MAG: PP2C family protein-serine/threonine phosphatase, partial [Stackebrandtia sp.]
DEAAGELASGLTIQTLRPLATRRGSKHPKADLRAAVEEASLLIKASVAEDPEREGMATTLTALLFGPEQVTVAHLGDSRAYRRRAGELTQLTRDDTYVQVLLEQGKLEPEEATEHPYRSMVTRVLHGQPAEASIRAHPAEAGDRYLVCSDGLTDVVPVVDVDATLRDEPEPQDCVERLVAMTLEAGAPDNVSVVVADVVDEPKQGGVRRLLRGVGLSREG